MDQHRFQQTLDEVMADRDLRYVVAYLAGLAMEWFREANNGDWAAATADIDLNLKLAEDLDGLGG
jgi:hypothetical protein